MAADPVNRIVHRLWSDACRRREQVRTLANKRGDLIASSSLVTLSPGEFDEISIDSIAEGVRDELLDLVRTDPDYDLVDLWIHDRLHRAIMVEILQPPH